MHGDIWTIVCSASAGGPKLDEAGALARRAQLERALVAAMQVSRPERVLVPLLESEQPWWQPLLKTLPVTSSLSQPIDRGCGVGLLVGLLRIREVDPDATAVVFTCRAWHSGQVDMARAGLAGLAKLPDRMHVAGYRPDPDDTEKGLWMVAKRPGEPQVSDAVLDPRAETRSYLLSQGAMKALPVVVARARTLMLAYEQLHPELVAQALQVIRPERASDPHALDELYPFVDAIDIERDVLAGVPDRLHVVPCTSTGYSTTWAPESPQNLPSSTSNVAV